MAAAESFCIIFTVDQNGKVAEIPAATFMKNRSWRWLVASVLARTMPSSPLLAQGASPSGSDMFVDLVVTRPPDLVGVAAGSVAFLVALPFTERQRRTLGRRFDK
jgi:hypothetical protein